MGKFGVPTDEQLAKINKLAKRTLSADEVFVFPGKMAGDMIIPDRYVQLTKELLDVFSVNANQGVSFLLDHSWHSDGFLGLGGRPKAALAYGRTFEGSVVPSSVEGEQWALNGNTYMMRNITLDGISTNDLIASIEAGTLFDTSIGFNYNKGICSICGNNYFDHDKCEHYAGKTYEVEGEDGVTRNMLAYIKAYPPGALWENSGVFDGAYPTAGMLSKDGDVFESENGIYQVISDLKGIDPTKPLIATYSERSGLLTMVKKAEHKKPFALGGLVQKAQGMMTDQESIFALGEKLGIQKEQVKNIAKTVLKGGEVTMGKEILEMLSKLGIAFEEGKTYSMEEVNTLVEAWGKKTQEEMDVLKAAATPMAGSSEVFMTKEQATEKLGKEMTSDEVLKLAVEGQDYHKKVVDEAIKMGAGAMGNDFPADTWKNTFATMGTQAILDITKTWETQKKDSIAAGRLSDPAAGQQQASTLPDEAFVVGK